MKYTYESSEKFLSMVEKEYESEKKRAAALDSKIALSLPVISAYFFLLAQDAHIRELWPSISETVYSSEQMRAFLPVVLYLIAVFTAFLALFWMIHATWAHHFMDLDVEQSYTAKVMSMPQELFSARIARYYLLQIKQNRINNRVTLKEYQLGWTFGLISLMCFLPYALMSIS